MKRFILTALCLILAGCSGMPTQQKPFAEPQYGMSRQKMFDLLGKPDSVEVYKQTDLTQKEFYMYSKKYGSASEQVPVCVVGNKVVGWGKTYYEDHVYPDDTKIR